MGRPASDGDEFEPWLGQFRDGLAVLLRDGVPIGHVATSLSCYRTLFMPWRQRPWVWAVIVWSDGTKEQALEDYEPWSYVAEMREGYFETLDGERFDIEWVPADQATAERERLGITLSDF